MSTPPVTTESLSALAGEWQRTRDRSRKYRFYFDRVRPAVTSLLAGQIDLRAREGEVYRYDALVLIIGHDVVPGLIIANAIRAGRLLVFHARERGEMVRTRFMPFVEGPAAGGITTVMIDPHDHDRNLSTMREAVSAIAGSGSVLCDITGGKKILGALLGIIAHDLNMDISYIDASSYVDRSSVPNPGAEVLYIHSRGRDTVTPIPVSPSRLWAHFMRGSGELLYSLDTGGAVAKTTRKKLPPSSIRAVGDELDKAGKKINANILAGTHSARELDAIAAVVEKLLLGSGMARALEQEGIGTPGLYVDPELAGIPWEIMLARRFGMALPVLRRFNLDADMSLPAPPAGEDNGILAVFGSGKDIAGFDETAGRMRRCLESLPMKARCVNAESAGSLGVEFASRRYGAIIYFGHAEYSADAQGTGWTCRNGEIFGCDQADILSSSPPAVVISNSCQSARSDPFTRHSMAFHMMKAGVSTYIGTRWFLEFDRSVSFLSGMIESMFERGQPAAASFRATMRAMGKKYGADDIALYNYVYYGN